MSTTKPGKKLRVGGNDFRMLGVRLRSIRFAEEDFLSLLDGHKKNVTKPRGMELSLQVSTGETEFSKYPPKDTNVIEIPLDISISVEMAGDETNVDIFHFRCFGGFVATRTISKHEFKTSFDKVKDGFDAILYYAIRSRVQDIINATVLRDVKLPWDMQFDGKRNRSRSNTSRTVNKKGKAAKR